MNLPVAGLIVMTNDTPGQRHWRVCVSYYARARSPEGLAEPLGQPARAIAARTAYGFEAGVRAFAFAETSRGPPSRFLSAHGHLTGESDGTRVWRAFLVAPCASRGPDSHDESSLPRIVQPRLNFKPYRLRFS